MVPNLKPPLHNNPPSLLRTVLSPNVVLKHSSYCSIGTISKELSDAACNAEYADTSVFNCLVDVSIQSKSMHVVDRYNNCLSNLAKLSLDLGKHVTHVQETYNNAGYSLAGFIDYCKHNKCNVNLGNIGNINITLTITNNSLNQSPPSFIVLADAVRDFAEKTVPMDKINNRISSRIYDHNYISQLQNDCEDILEKTISFAGSVAISNGWTEEDQSKTCASSSVFTISSIALPFYEVGEYAKVLADFSINQLYLELNEVIANLNTCNKVFQKQLVNIIKYIDKVIIPTSKDLHLIMSN